MGHGCPWYTDVMKVIHKVLLSIIIIVLLAFLVISSHKNKEVVTVSPEDPVTEVETTEGVFKNSEFTFQYPVDRIAKDYNEISPWRTNTQTKGVFHVGILIPSSVQPNTNFREAKFTIGSSSDPLALVGCLVPTNGERAKGEVIIQGIVFKKITLTEAGAGNYYDTTSYRTIHENMCYVVEYTIHSSNLRNYSPEQNIQEFDTPFIVETLESMAKSFQFL